LFMVPLSSPRLSRINQNNLPAQKDHHVVFLISSCFQFLALHYGELTAPQPVTPRPPPNTLPTAAPHLSKSKPVISSSFPSPVFSFLCLSLILVPWLTCALLSFPRLTCFFCVWRLLAVVFTCQAFCAGECPFFPAFFFFYLFFPLFGVILSRVFFLCPPCVRPLLYASTGFSFGTFFVSSPLWVLVLLSLPHLAFHVHHASFFKAFFWFVPPKV